MSRRKVQKKKKRKTCPFLRLSCRACILRLCHIRLRALSVLRRRNCELYRVCFPYRRSITAIVVKPCVLRALSQRLRSPFSDKSFRELTANEQQVTTECDYRSSSCIRLRHRAWRNYSSGKQQTAYSSSVCWCAVFASSALLCSDPSLTFSEAEAWYPIGTAQNKRLKPSCFLSASPITFLSRRVTFFWRLYPLVALGFCGVIASFLFPLQER